MNVLLTNIWLDNYAGTEVYVRDLSIKLKSEGMGVEVYSPLIGKVASEIMSYGINVVTSVNDLKNIPDIIHGQHIVVLDAINKFPKTPVIYFCHSGNIPEEDPVIHHNIKRYVAVDQFCLERLESKGINNSEIIHNWIDTNKFKQKEKINETPHNALLISNTLTYSNSLDIKKACKESNIALDFIGNGFGKSVKNPESILGNYDIVFAKAKCAIEAMGCGCAVILNDFAGLGEMVTTQNYDNARKYNFGFKMLKIYDIQKKSRIKEQINRYNASDIKMVSDNIRRQSSFDNIFQEIISIYKRTLN